MPDFAADAAAILRGPLSVAATWTAPGEGGQPVALRALPAAGSAAFRLAGADLPAGAAMFRVLAADVAEPAIGGVLSVGGVAWTVVAPPLSDARGLIWSLEVQRR